MLSIGSSATCTASRSLNQAARYGKCAVAALAGSPVAAAAARRGVARAGARARRLPAPGPARGRRRELFDQRLPLHRPAADRARARALRPRRRRRAARRRIAGRLRRRALRRALAQRRLVHLLGRAAGAAPDALPPVRRLRRGRGVLPPGFDECAVDYTDAAALLGLAVETSLLLDAPTRSHFGPREETLEKKGYWTGAVEIVDLDLSRVAEAVRRALAARARRKAAS